MFKAECRVFECQAFKAAYEAHVAERATQGIPPLALDASQATACTAFMACYVSFCWVSAVLCQIPCDLQQAECVVEMLKKAGNTSYAVGGM